MTIPASQQVFILSTVQSYFRVAGMKQGIVPQNHLTQIEDLFLRLTDELKYPVRVTEAKETAPKPVKVQRPKKSPKK